MIGTRVLQEAKGGFSKSMIEELAPVFSELGKRVFDRVKKYAHSPMKWRVEYNERSGFSFVDFETTDLSDIEVKGDVVIDWMGSWSEPFVRVAVNASGGVRGAATRDDLKVYWKDPLDNLVNVIIGTFRDMNLHQEK
jgi:hypothetical protein